MGSCGGYSLGKPNQGQKNMKRRSFLQLTFHFNLAAVFLNNSVHDRQPEAGATLGRLRRKEGLEDPLLDGRRNAAAGIDHINGDPLWGFADVVASETDGVEIGTRVYGYLPPASHLLVQPTRVDERGFRDARDYRQALPSPYNVYALTTADPAVAMTSRRRSGAANAEGGC